MAYGLRRAERMANGRWQEAPSASIAPVALIASIAQETLHAMTRGTRYERRELIAYGKWQAVKS